MCASLVFKSNLDINIAGIFLIFHKMYAIHIMHHFENWFLDLYPWNVFICQALFHCNAKTIFYFLHFCFCCAIPIFLAWCEFTTNNGIWAMTLVMRCSAMMCISQYMPVFVMNAFCTVHERLAQFYSFTELLHPQTPQWPWSCNE